MVVGGWSKRGRLLLGEVDVLVVTPMFSFDSTPEASAGCELVLSNGLVDIWESMPESRSRFLGFVMMDCVSGISREAD